MGFNFEGIVYVYNIYFKWDKSFKMFRIIISIYNKMTFYFKCTSYLCEVSRDLYYTNSQSEKTFLLVLSLIRVRLRISSILNPTLGESHLMKLEQWNFFYRYILRMKRIIIPLL